MLTKAKTSHKLLLSTLWLVFVVYGFYYVYSAAAPYISGNESLSLPGFSTLTIFQIGLLFALMFCNWAIEAFKWNLSIRDFEPQIFVKSLKSTLVGVAVSTWMPNRVGEYIGKVFYVKEQNRFKGAISALFVSYTQIISTLFFGILGGLYYLWNHPVDSRILGVVLLSLLVVLIMFLALSRKEFIRKKLSLSNRYIRLFFRTITRFSSQQTAVFILLSVLRFAVFNLQFIICLQIFGASTPWLQTFLLISLIYGMQTITPATALAGLGIRGALSLYFLSPLVADSAIILSASYSLWLVNLFIPSFIGWLFLIFSPVRVEAKNMILAWLRHKPTGI
ncbi:hypothetical protein GC194_12625 [bacterium]|nr:hypothetical protein [bacterium]